MRRNLDRIDTRRRTEERIALGIIVVTTLAAVAGIILVWIALRN